MGTNRTTTPDRTLIADNRELLRGTSAVARPLRWERTTDGLGDRRFECFTGNTFVGSVTRKPGLVFEAFRAGDAEELTATAANRSAREVARALRSACEFVMEPELD